jgi:hypothetical protein
MTAQAARHKEQQWCGDDAETKSRILAKLRTAKRLIQSQEQWQFLNKRLRVWLATPDGKQVRPPVMLIIDLYPHGALRAHRFPENATSKATLPTACEALEFILDEMLTPQRDSAVSARPANISFTSHELAELLSEPLGYLLRDELHERTEVVETDPDRMGSMKLVWRPSVLAEAEGVREFMRRFAENLVAKGKGATSTASESPGLIQTLMLGGERRDGFGAQRYVLRPLAVSDATAAVAIYYRLACLWYERRPWEHVHESWLFRVESICGAQAFTGSVPEALRRHMRFLVVLGGEAPGFVGLPSVRAARKRYASSVCARKEANASPGICTDSQELAQSGTPSYTPSDVVASLSEDNIPDVVLCAYTGRVIPGPYAYRCSRCKNAYYLDREAQKADWQRHAPECESMATSHALASELTHLAKQGPPLIFRHFWRYAEVVQLYMEESALCFDDLDAIEEHNWPIANKGLHAWPVPFVTVGGHSMPRPSVERPNLEELSWMIAIMSWMLEHQGIEQLQTGMQMPTWKNEEHGAVGADSNHCAVCVQVISVEAVEDMAQTEKAGPDEGAERNRMSSG